MPPNDQGSAAFLALLEKTRREAPPLVRRWESEAKRKFALATQDEKDCWEILLKITKESVVSQLAQAVCSGVTTFFELAKYFALTEKIISAISDVLDVYEKAGSKATEMTTAIKRFESLPLAVRSAIVCVNAPITVKLRCTNIEASTKVRAWKKLNAQIPDSPTGYYIKDVVTLDYFKRKGMSTIRNETITKLGIAMGKIAAANEQYKIVSLVTKQMPKIAMLIDQEKRKLQQANVGQKAFAHAGGH
jgi:hypothetical protein